MNKYVDLARKGANIYCWKDEFLLCHFLWFFVILPLGFSVTRFLLQDSLEPIKVAGGILYIKHERERSIPLFLEQCVCEISEDIAVGIFNMPDRTFSHTRSIKESNLDYQQEPHKQSLMDILHKATEKPQLPRKIKQYCLPPGCELNFDPTFEHCAVLSSGYKIISGPILSVSPQDKKQKSYTWLCSMPTGRKFGLLRIENVQHSLELDVVYAFDFSYEEGKVTDLVAVSNIKNKRHITEAIASNASIIPAVASNLEILLNPLTQTVKKYYLPEECRAEFNNSRVGVTLSGGFTVTSKPILMSRYATWVCSTPHGENFAIFRMVKREIGHGEPAFDYVIALAYETNNEAHICDLCIFSQVSQQNLVDQVITEFLTSQSFSLVREIVTSSIEVMLSSTYKEDNVVRCLPTWCQGTFYPIEEHGIYPQSACQIHCPLIHRIANNVKVYSWLCTSDAIVFALMKYDIANKAEVFLAMELVYSEYERSFTEIQAMQNINKCFYMIASKLLSEYCNELYKSVSQCICESVNSISKFTFTNCISTEEETIMLDNRDEFFRTMLNVHTMMSPTDGVGKDSETATQCISQSDKGLCTDISCLTTHTSRSKPLPPTRKVANIYCQWFLPPFCTAELDSSSSDGLKLSDGFEVVSGPLKSHTPNYSEDISIWLCSTTAGNRLEFGVVHLQFKALGSEQIATEVGFAVNFMYTEGASPQLHVGLVEAALTCPEIVGLFTSRMMHISSKLEQLIESPIFFIAWYLPTGCQATFNPNTRTELELTGNYRVLCPPISLPRFKIWLCSSNSGEKFAIVQIQAFAVSKSCEFALSIDFITDGSHVIALQPMKHLPPDDLPSVQQFATQLDMFNPDFPVFKLICGSIEVMLDPFYQRDGIQRFVPSDCICIAQNEALWLSSCYQILNGPISTKLTGTLQYSFSTWLCVRNSGELISITKVIISDKVDLLAALTFGMEDENVRNLRVLTSSSNSTFLAETHLEPTDPSSPTIRTLTSQIFQLMKTYLGRNSQLV